MHLPEFWKLVSHLNPFFYIIDGFRFGLTGQNDGSLNVGMVYILLINFVLLIVLYGMIKRGRGIKQ